MGIDKTKIQDSIEFTEGGSSQKVKIAPRKIPVSVGTGGGCGSGCGCGSGGGGGCGSSRRSTEIGPAASAIKLHQPERSASRFEVGQLPDAWDLSRHPRVGAILRSRKFQFMAILPNQIIFWMVIFIGLAGTAIPGLNFGASITWYVWFCLLFIMMAIGGRTWCLMCPFGGFGEWVQKLSFWSNSQRRLGLGLKFPERMAGYGALWSVGIFIALTWIEEFFNIAGPGNPITTGWLVIGIISGALLFFLVFERRSFCRYLCPLTSMIATFSQIGSVAGFRTRDREKCLSCETKDCMRGGAHGAGCPWYTWPGSADSISYCGMCTECYKACPYDNIGFYVQKPLGSVVTATNRRIDIGWTLAALAGLVLFQQINAMSFYGPIDGWLTKQTGIPYPNPIDYLGIIAGVTFLLAGIGWAFGKIFGSPDVVQLSQKGDTYITKVSTFRSFFVPVMYGMIPVVGMDYFARQLPKFLKHVTRVPVSFEHLWGAGSSFSFLYNYRILTNHQIIDVQMAVVALGAIGSAWALWRITNRELLSLVRDKGWASWGIKIASSSLALTMGAIMAFMYSLMGAAN